MSPQAFFFNHPSLGPCIVTTHTGGTLLFQLVSAAAPTALKEFESALAYLQREGDPRIQLVGADANRVGWTEIAFALCSDKVAKFAVVLSKICREGALAKIQLGNARKEVARLRSALDAERQTRNAHEAALINNIRYLQKFSLIGVVVIVASSLAVIGAILAGVPHEQVITTLMCLMGLYAFLGIYLWRLSNKVFEHKTS